MQPWADATSTQAKRDFATPGAFAWNRKFFLSNGRMTDEDMKVIFNDWRHDVGTWMRPSSLRTYNALMRNGKRGCAQKLGKSAWSTYKFQLSGCPFLIDLFIRFPIVCSQPSCNVPIGRLLIELITAFQEHKKTEAYVSVVENANKSASARRWERNQIWWAEYNHSQGQTLSSQVAAGTIDFYSLDDQKESK